VIVEAEYYTIQIQFFRSRQSYFEKITILYKTWLKVFGVEESESVLSFSKFWVWFFQSRKGYFEKITIFYKTWLKVFGVEESESVLSFSKFWVWYFSQWIIISKNRLQIPIPWPRKPLVKFYKTSLFSQNNPSLTEKIKLKISKNWEQIRIPRPQKPLVKFYKISLFSQNSLVLVEKIEFEWYDTQPQLSPQFL
jgi:hypothetical protein